MTNKELVKRWEGFGNCDFDKTLYQEYISFCNNADQYDFESYFKQKEIDNFDFLALLNCMYRNECYNMMYRLLRDNRDKIINPNISKIADMKLQKHLDERMKRLIM